MTALLRYAGATIGYAGPVVSAVDLDVSPGEIVGLIGPNGAGKTTLMRAVTGNAAVLAGEVLVEGRPAASYGSRRLARLVGVLPQSVSADFSFTSREFVEMGRHAHARRFGELGEADRSAVDEAMRLTDTTELAAIPVDTLSGGDLQRLTLAQALAQQPSVLLLDEPTSHLDLNHRLQVLDSVRSLADSGLAVLAVFHDLDMAARYSDRLAVVHAGRVRPAGRPDEVLTARTMREVFGVSAVIGQDVVTGSVQVLPVVRVAGPSRRRGSRVLVVSGSGSGAAVMRRLVLEGHDVRAAALARGDTDHDVAVALDMPVVSLPLHGSMTEADAATVADAAGEADAVVVVATPFGPGNIPNLRAVVERRVPTVLVGSLDPAADYSRGEATQLWTELAARGALTCREVRDVVHCVEEVLRRR